MKLYADIDAAKSSERKEVIAVNMTYDGYAVDALKDAIDYRCRQWLPLDKIWYIAPRYGKTVIEVLNKHRYTITISKDAASLMDKYFVIKRNSKVEFVKAPKIMTPKITYRRKISLSGEDQ